MWRHPQQLCVWSRRGFASPQSALSSCRKHYFAVRVINVWNSLPDEVVSTNHEVIAVQNSYKKINLNNFLIGKAWLVVLPFSSSSVILVLLCICVFVFLFLVTCKWCHHPLSTVRHWVLWLWLCLFYAYFNVLLICLQNIWKNMKKNLYRRLLKQHDITLQQSWRLYWKMKMKWTAFVQNHVEACIIRRF